MVDWIINYVKNRDSIAKKIENIEKNKGGFDVFVKFNDREQYFIVIPFINNIDGVLTKIKEDMHFGLVVFNTKENFKVVTDNWKKLINFKHLSIYFINPFSQLDKKWIIYPYTHNRICDEGSLELGLKTMFEMVEPISEEKAKTLIK